MWRKIDRRAHRNSTSETSHTVGGRHARGHDGRKRVARRVHLAHNRGELRPEQSARSTAMSDSLPASRSRSRTACRSTAVTARAHDRQPAARPHVIAAHTAAPHLSPDNISANAMHALARPTERALHACAHTRRGEGSETHMWCKVDRRAHRSSTNETKCGRRHARQRADSRKRVGRRVHLAHNVGAL